jgi:hypothetical protein
VNVSECIFALADHAVMLFDLPERDQSAHPYVMGAEILVAEDAFR